MCFRSVLALWKIWNQCAGFNNEWAKFENTALVLIYMGFNVVVFVVELTNTLNWHILTFSFKQVCVTFIWHISHHITSHILASKFKCCLSPKGKNATHGCESYTHTAGFFSRYIRISIFADFNSISLSPCSFLMDRRRCRQINNISNT